MKNVCINPDCKKYGRHQASKRVRCIKCKGHLTPVSDKTWLLVYSRRKVSEISVDLIPIEIPKGKIQLSIFDSSE